MPDFCAGTRSKAYLSRKRITGRAKHEFLAGTSVPPSLQGLTMATRCLVVAVLVTVCFCPAAPAQDAIAAGEQVYEEHCASCHGEKLRSTGAIPDLKEQRADGRARFDQMVMNGRGQMPAWQGIVSQDQLEALWAYIRSRARD
jgi:mono/diheme cytochrome c family protein